VKNCSKIMMSSYSVYNKHVNYIITLNYIKDELSAAIKH